MANRPMRGSERTLQSAPESARGSPGQVAAGGGTGPLAQSAEESGPRLSCGSRQSVTRGDAGPCLAAELVDALLAGVLDESERLAAYEHLSQCVLCVERLSVAGQALPADGALAPGELVARRYRIIRFVARGGMGEVYEAYDTELSVRVALKAVIANDEQSPLAARALSREVLLARSIAHPNVCRIYDLGLDETGPRALPLRFLTMEFVDGVRLTERVCQGPLPLAEVSVIGQQLLLGLAAAHRAGVLHRDFKSDNVMLRAGANGAAQAVIMDFGLARSLVSADAWWNSGNHRIEGSLLSMAPEQIMAQPLGWQTDIFAFGVVMFEMLTGTSPFESQVTLAAALKRCQEPPPRPSRLRPELSPALDRLVERCLAPEREQRFAEVSLVQGALQQALGIEPPRVSARAWPMPAFAAVLCAAAVLQADAALRTGAALRRPARALEPDRVAALRPARAASANNTSNPPQPVAAAPVIRAELTGAAPPGAAAPAAPAAAVRTWAGAARPEPVRSARRQPSLAEQSLQAPGASVPAPAQAAAPAASPSAALAPQKPARDSRDSLLDPFAVPEQAPRAERQE